MYIKDDRFRYKGISDEFLQTMLLSRDEEILELQRLIRLYIDDNAAKDIIIKQYYNKEAR